jgi:hypothetical protein
MYLSDLFVSAWKSGGDAHVDVLFDILENLPGDFWDKMGGYTWVGWVKAKYKLDKNKFYSDLERYANSKEWSDSIKPLGEYIREQEDANL